MCWSTDDVISLCSTVRRRNKSHGLRPAMGSALFLKLRAKKTVERVAGANRQQRALPLAQLFVERQE